MFRRLWKKKSKSDRPAVAQGLLVFEHTPATQVYEIIRYIPQALEQVLSGKE